MKASYITPYDSSDVHAWSGLGFWIGKALKDAGVEIEPFGGLTQERVWISYAKRLFYPNVLGKRFLRDRDPHIIRGYGRQISRHLAQSDSDIVIGPGTGPFTWVETDKPLVFWTDSVFAGMLGFYDDFSNLSAETIRWGHYYEQTVIDRCALAIFSSQWAANDAIQHYGADPAKVKVVPFGANTAAQYSTSEIAAIAEAKPFDRLRLLFIAVDWKRKGGDFLLEIAAELRRRKLPVEVDIVGVQPEGHPLPEGCRCHGFISKKTPEGQAQFDALMKNAHFLVLPTRADCAPVVFAEAASYGLPCLSTNVGGIKSQIAEGQNGWTFPLEAPATEWADRMERLFCHREEYERLVLSSFEHYSDHLNWEAAGRNVRQLLEGVVGR